MNLSEDVPVIVDLAPEQKEDKKKPKKRTRDGKANTPQKKPKEKKAKSDHIKNTSAHKKLKFLASCNLSAKEDEAEMKKKLQEINALDEKKAEEQLDNERTRGATSVALRLSEAARMVTGSLADAILGGKGEILKRFKHDKELDATIATEFLSIAHLLNNRAKLATLAGSNCFYGKMDAMSKKDDTEQEEVNDPPVTTSSIVIEEIVETPQFPRPEEPSSSSSSSVSSSTIKDLD